MFVYGQHQVLLHLQNKKQASQALVSLFFSFLFYHEVYSHVCELCPRQNNAQKLNQAKKKIFFFISDRKYINTVVKSLLKSERLGVKVY